MSGFRVGDLVIYKSMSPDIIKNQLGIILKVNITTEFQENFLTGKKWYVVQFGTFILVVIEEMIENISIQLDN